MAEISDPFSNPPPTHFLSDDLDVDPTPTPTPIFQPFLRHDDVTTLDHHHHHHHHHINQDAFFNNLFHSPHPGPGPAGFGLDLGLGPPDQRPDLFGQSGAAEVDLELGLGLGSGLGSTTCRVETGLRVGSDTDSEDGFLRDLDLDEEVDGDHGFGGVSDFDRPPFCWDYLGFNNRGDIGTRNVGDGSRVCEDGGENLSVVDESDDVDAGVSILFDSYHEREERREVVVESDEEELGGEGGVFGVEDDAVRELEWEILVAVNNFNREVYDMDFNVDMYEAILGEVEERMNEWRGSPPAALAVVESLPSVRVESEVVCAICKDEVSGEEVVRQLPCLHYYHGECILPWLKMRNTCPVCRFELPTDDAEYEFRKREREGVSVDVNVGLSMDSQVSYDFHVFL